ncbi:MAG: RidA family protein [Siphonobacter sp.]
MKKNLLILTLCILTGFLLATRPNTTRDSLNIKADYPFSKAVRAGDFIFLSGQIGTLPDGSLADGFEAQAKQTMENLKAVLHEEGLTMADVVKCTVMIEDMSKWADFNTIYRSYFKPGHYPARSAFGAKGLALGAALEVDMVAYAPAKGEKHEKGKK